MLTVGVDLAAEAANTAWAAIDWHEDGTADLHALHLGADDKSILDGHAGRLGLNGLPIRLAGHVR